jgi:hypothetical protein
MSALTDIWNTIHGIITSADVITLVIMAVIAIAVAFFSEGLGSLVTVTLLALVVFALATFARAALTGPNNKDIAGLAQTDWHNLMGVQTGTLLAYAIIFAVVIAIVSTVRSLLMR